jgi:hypothetical protein
MFVIALIVVVVPVGRLQRRRLLHLQSRSNSFKFFSLVTKEKNVTSGVYDIITVFDNSSIPYDAIHDKVIHFLSQLAIGSHRAQ